MSPVNSSREARWEKADWTDVLKRLPPVLPGARHAQKYETLSSLVRIWADASPEAANRLVDLVDSRAGLLLDEAGVLRQQTEAEVKSRLGKGTQQVARRFRNRIDQLRASVGNACEPALRCILIAVWHGDFDGIARWRWILRSLGRINLDLARAYQWYGRTYYLDMSLAYPAGVNADDQDLPSALRGTISEAPLSAMRDARNRLRASTDSGSVWPFWPECLNVAAIHRIQAEGSAELQRRDTIRLERSALFKKANAILGEEEANRTVLTLAPDEQRRALLRRMEEKGQESRLAACRAAIADLETMTGRLSAVLHVGSGAIVTGAQE